MWNIQTMKQWRHPFLFTWFVFWVTDKVSPIEKGERQGVELCNNRERIQGKACLDRKTHAVAWDSGGDFCFLIFNISIIISFSLFTCRNPAWMRLVGARRRT